MSASIEIAKLSKRYPHTAVYSLKDLSLQVQPGEVYGFLGANGAGKTTTIRTLLNFIQPTSGSARIMGQDIVRDSVAVKRSVGYLSGETSLYQKVTGKQFLAYMAQLQPPKHKDYLAELVKQFEVDLDKPLETLSKGNRQKIGLLQAFMHEPAVLILDEPTSGLDPLMQEQFFKLVATSKARGAAIFLSSHNLGEAQRICDRVGIIKHGELIREQTIDNLTPLGKPTFRITLKNHAAVQNIRAAAQLTFVSQVDSNTVLVQPSNSIAAALAALSHFEIEAMDSEKADLEDEFIEFYGDNT